MSPALRQFLADWLAWAEAGAPEHPAFQSNSGLLWNGYLHGGFDLMVEAARLDDGTYPFGEDRFSPARLAWVRHQLGVEG